MTIASDHRRHTAARESHRRRTERWIQTMNEPLGPTTPWLAPPRRA